MFIYTSRDVTTRKYRSEGGSLPCVCIGKTVQLDYTITSTRPKLIVQTNNRVGVRCLTIMFSKVN